MRYLKVFLLVLIFFIVMMFFVQNQASFADPVVLKLDLLLIEPIETIPLPLYSVMLICFALGAFIVLLMLMWDRVTLSSRAMSARRRANVLEKKLSKVESELNALQTKHAESENKLKAELEATEKRLDSVLRASE
ncbi:MAG: lipopolysaccharide assembly protein LapA domain-containing protein [Mailhella sp.]|nr:lipopolysaccharide assembly protein LapA domain-containing protein [Mailhella sp.]